MLVIVSEGTRRWSGWGGLEGMYGMIIKCEPKTFSLHGLEELDLAVHHSF